MNSMFSSKKEKALAKSTVSSISHSGYLTKQAKHSKANWKKRYFVINENTLTYFLDHRHTDVPKGDVLLTATSTVSDFTDQEGHTYGFEVKTELAVLRMAAKDETEREEWKQHIRVAIANLQKSLRGYLRKAGRFLEAKEVKKFFMLHSDCITYHADITSTSAIQGMRKFSAKTTVDKPADQPCVLIIRTNLPDGKFWKLRADTTKERDNWAEAVMAVVGKLGFMEVDFQDRTAADLAKECTRSGFLHTRPKEGRNQEWEEAMFILSESKLFQFEDADARNPTQVLVLSPNCSVFETKLKPFAFELVTNSKVLHVQGASAEDTSSWIAILRSAIARSAQLSEDPLLIAARKQKSIFYDVVFETKKPLGLVLERSGDWALVKLANQETTHVSIGSALTTVNDDEVVIKPYAETIKKLTAWQPPLKLGFRLAPEKRGWLTKQGRGRKSQRKNWKPRFFVLAEGRLSYFSDDGPDAVLKGVVHLMGSAVSLVPRSETSQYFCFKVVSGITGIIMQGLTVDDMMEWASTIYHAISVANGGGYLLQVERDRVKALADEKSRLEEARAASEELERKRKAEADAVAAVKAAEEAGQRARAELDLAKKEGRTASVDFIADLEAEQRKILELKKQESEAQQQSEAALKKVEEITTEIASIEYAEAASSGAAGATSAGYDSADEEDEEEEEPTAWQAYWNSSHNVWYYYNIETQETTWTRPEGEEITINQPETYDGAQVVEAQAESDGGAQVDAQAEGGSLNDTADTSTAAPADASSFSSSSDAAAEAASFAVGELSIAQASDSASEEITAEKVAVVVPFAASTEYSVADGVVEAQTEAAPALAPASAPDSAPDVDADSCAPAPAPATAPDADTDTDATAPAPAAEIEVSAGESASLESNLSSPSPVYYERGSSMSMLRTVSMTRTGSTTSSEIQSSVVPADSTARPIMRRKSSVILSSAAAVLPPPPFLAASTQSMQRRTSLGAVPPPVVAPPPPTSADRQVPEDPEDEDEDEANFADGSARANVDEYAGVVLTDDDLQSIFATVDHGQIRGQLNPMLFGTLIRAITGKADLFSEMKYFQTFNTSGDGVIDLEEFVVGAKKIRLTEGPNSKFYFGLIQYHQSATVCL